MALKKELKIQSFVLLARKPSVFNPSNFNQYWLDHNNIMPASSLDKNSQFTPIIVQAQSNEMIMLVTPDQLQVTPKIHENFKTIVIGNIVAVVNNMEKVDLRGFGLNFVWFVSDSGENYEALSHGYFFNAQNPAIAFFPKEKSLYGEYLSTQIEDEIRMNLDIKPVQLFDPTSDKLKYFFQFAFNFHSDLKDDNQYEKVIFILKKFDTWYSYSEKIMNLYE